MPAVVAALVLALSSPQAAFSIPGVQEAITGGAASLQAGEAREGYSPWTAIALRAAGFAPRPGVAAYLDGLEPGGPTTDYALALLAVIAEKGPSGAAATDLARRLAEAQQPDGKFADYIDGTGGELVNAHVWAIIALRASGNPVPDPEQARAWLVARQHPDGGFSYAVGVETSDVDMTAMALSAFAALERGTEDPAVRRALDYLRSVQSEVTGGFGGWGLDTNADSCAAVIQALVALGLDPAGPEWTNHAGNPVAALLELQTGDGAFAYAAGLDANPLSTRQAVLALADLWTGTPFWERLGRVFSPDLFPDVSTGHWAYEELAFLTARGVIGGYPDGTFRPAHSLTRAEFARMVAAAVGVRSGPRKAYFRDVHPSHWAFGAVQALAAHGLVRGVAENIYDPGGTVTGAQVVAVMVRFLGLEPPAVDPKEPWWSGVVKRAGERGLLYPGFDPGIPATRAQTAWSLARTLESGPAG
jgi:hypothetical protein